MKIFTSLLLSLAYATLLAQERFEIRNPEIIEGIFMGETKPLRELVLEFNDEVVSNKPERLGYHPKKNWPLNESLNPNALPQGEDPAWQKDYSASKGVKALELNVPGMGYTFVNPSDPNLDVGPNHVIQMINATSVAIYDKITGQLVIPPFSLGILGGCANGYGDPIVLYDHLADRWLLSEFGGGNSLCVLISQTPDPTGPYYSYQFPTPSFPDYPKYAVWPNGYYITTNESTPAIYALDRTKMLAGLPSTSQRFITPKYPTISFQSNTPVALSGPNLPPAGTSAMFMRMADDAWSVSIPYDRLEIFELTIDFVTPSNSVLTGPTWLQTAPFDTELNGYTAFAAFPQPGTSLKLDPLREVLMYRVQYRNFGTHESIVCNHVTDVDGNDRGGVRWYELRRTGNNPWQIYQQGTYSPDADNRWMGAIAINGDGDIGLMYNITSSTTYPGIRFTGRKYCDPLGIMTVPETIIAVGAAANGSNRYGDYNSLSVDPTDQTTFWGTAQYNPTSQWSTKIAAFRLDDTPCCYPDLDNDGYGDPNGTPIPSVNGICTAGYASNRGDCDDTNPNINPGMPEICDGLDNNCNGQIDEDDVCCVSGNLIFVNVNASGNNSGHSWENAFTDLRAAMESACSFATEIWVAKGTYKPTGGYNRSVSFPMKNNLKIYGGFKGNETNRSQRDWVTNVTILSGDIGEEDDYSDNSYSVISSLNIDNSAVLDGFTITGGNANGTSPYNRGGGMLNTGSFPIINNCKFIENAASNGGAMYNSNSSPIINNCVFYGNYANIGGAVSTSNGSPVISNCSFYGNAPSAGGAMRNVLNSVAYINNSIFWGNGIEISNNMSAAIVNYSIVSGGYTGVGILNLDPLFVNPGSGDLRLQPQSPAVNAGTPDTTGLNLPLNDLAGNPRITDGTIDIGAYEYIDLRQLSLKVFLEGPFNGNNMDTTLLHKSLIPLNQPYNQAPWNYAGSESVAEIPDSVVDWVLVELRLSPGYIFLTRMACFLKYDGTIVNPQGNPVSFQMSPGDVYAAIFHRNHLGILSANPLVQSSGAFSYDFTTSGIQAYNNGQKEISTGQWGMVAGDANASGFIDLADKTAVWNLQVGKTNYPAADHNLDGQVDNRDKNELWLINTGTQTQVPDN